MLFNCSVKLSFSFSFIFNSSNKFLLYFVKALIVNMPCLKSSCKSLNNNFNSFFIENNELAESDESNNLLNVKIELYLDCNLFINPNLNYINKRKFYFY